MKLPLDAPDRRMALPPGAALLKRSTDIVLALLLAPLVLPATLILALFARVSTGESGIFRQRRVGLFGEPFTLLKIRSMRPGLGPATNVTTAHDPRITRFGRFLRRSKCDEFPQLWNVLRGDMSFVGPRPDVPETYARLDEAHSAVLCLRPGITGPATIAFRNEEELLAAAADPAAYNRDVLFPAKVKANLDYIATWNWWTDMRILLQTVFR